MHLGRDLTLRSKLLLAYSFALLLSVALGGGLAYWFLANIITDRVGEEMEQAALMISQSVQLAGEVGVRSMLHGHAETNLQVIREMYSEGLASGRDMDVVRSEAERYLLSQRIGREGYIYCLSSAGTILVHPVAELQGSSFAGLEFIRAQMKRREGYIEYEWKNPGEAEPRVKALYMTYFAPWDWIISVSGYRSEFGALVNEQDLDLVLNQVRLSKSGFSFLLTADRGMLMGDRGGADKEERSVYHLFAEEMLSRRSGRIEYQWHDAERGEFRDRLLVFKDIPRFGWVVGVAGFRDELFAKLHQLRVWLVIITAVIFLIIVLVVHALGRVIVVPVHDLIACFRQGAAGDYSTRSLRESGDELGQMGRLFNRFMERLQEHTEQMEHTVAARTEELAHMNGEYLREINEKTRIEGLLREQVGFMDTLLATIPSPVFYRGADGRFLGCSASFAADLLNSHPESVKGRRVSDFPQLYSLRECKDIMRSDAHILSTGQRVKAELHLLCADGALHDFVVEKAAFRNSEGEIAGIVGVMVDITERKQAEQARALLERAVERASSAIFITHAESGVMVYVNSAFEEDTGYGRDEAVGRHYLLLAGGRQDAFAGAVETVGQKNVWAGRLANVRKDGSSYETETSVSTIHDEQGVVRWLVFVQNDITDRVLMETKLLQAQKLEAIGQLAAGIAHEINTPSQFVGDNLRFVGDSIGGLLEIAAACSVLVGQDPQRPLGKAAAENLRLKLEEADYEFLREELPQAVVQAQEGVNRISTIVRAMKEFSHPGRREKQWANLNNAIRNTLTVTRNEWKYAAEVALDLEESLPDVLCLPAELNQVFMNIIINAAQAILEKSGRDAEGGSGHVQDALEKGEISITSRRVDDHVVITIGDTGIGIAEDALSHIFDPFYTTKDVGKGTGQGLAISRDVIVNKHQGSLDVQSTLGVGTRFTITLPVS